MNKAVKLIILLLISVALSFSGCVSDSKSSNLKDNSKKTIQNDSGSKTTKNDKSSSKIENSKSNITTTNSANENSSSNQYKIVYKNENGKMLSSQKVNKGSVPTPPKSPTKKGYYFYSWSREPISVRKNMTITPVFIKNGSEPEIQIEKVTANKNEKGVAVDIMVKNNPGIASIAIDVIYNEKYLEMTDFKYNTDSLQGAATVPFNENSEPKCLSMVNGIDNIFGDFVLATIYFDVLDNAKGDYPIVLSCDNDNIYNIDEKNVDFKLVNGLISIN